MFYLPIPPAPPQLIPLFIFLLFLFYLHHMDPTSNSLHLHFLLLLIIIFFTDKLFRRSHRQDPGQKGQEQAKKAKNRPQRPQSGTKGIWRRIWVLFFSLVNMHHLRAKNHWTRTRTITAAGNRTCKITLRLSDFKSQASFSLFLRHHELTNEKVSCFSNQPIENQTFTDLKATKKPLKPVKPTKNSTQLYLNKISGHFVREIKLKGYDVIGVNVFPCKLMRFCRKHFYS